MHYCLKSQETVLTDVLLLQHSTITVNKEFELFFILIKEFELIVRYRHASCIYQLNGRSACQSMRIKYVSLTICTYCQAPFISPFEELFSST